MDTETQTPILVILRYNCVDLHKNCKKQDIIASVLVPPGRCGSDPIVQRSKKPVQISCSQATVVVGTSIGLYQGSDDIFREGEARYVGSVEHHIFVCDLDGCFII